MSEAVRKYCADDVKLEREFVEAYKMSVWAHICFLLDIPWKL
jgi:hypothetical protein